MPSFRVQQVDGLVWEWISSIFEDEDYLRQSANKYRETYEARAKPLRRELALIEATLAEREKELTQANFALRALQGISDVESSVALTLNDISRLDGVIKELTRQRAEVEAKIDALVLSEATIQKTVDYVQEIKAKAGAGLDIANADFKKRRWVIEALNVEATLFVENGIRSIETRCYFGEKVLELSDTTSGSGSQHECASITGLRLVIDL